MHLAEGPLLQKKKKRKEECHLRIELGMFFFCSMRVHSVEIEARARSAATHNERARRHDDDICGQRSECVRERESE